MSGFAFEWNKSPAGVPQMREMLVGKSTELHGGDVLILTQHATYSANNVPVGRPLLSGDAITTSNGIFGVMPYDMQTDANGYATTVNSPVTVDGRSKVTPAVSSLGALSQLDSASGFLKVPVFAFSLDNVFSALTASNVVASGYLEGRQAGISASAASAPAVHTVNGAAAAANACLHVDGVDVLHPQYNSANGGGRVFVHCKNAFDQQETGAVWAT